MADEQTKVIVRETYTLKKFDGDDQTREPVEVIEVVIENGKEVKRTVIQKGENHGTH